MFSQAWESITFLYELCHNVGFPQGSWRESDAELFSFESESWVEN
ncbi:MAG: hypothetical protein OSB08_02645 [SAR324 cluster bacterium]|nr:hypothetical protein [SAR324 cluster bacterium]